MQTFDLIHLCTDLRRKLERMRYEILVDELIETFRYALGKKIDKDGLRHVKEMLYRFETLIVEIEDVTEVSRFPGRVLMREIKTGLHGECSEFFGKSFTSKIASEIEHITKELKPYLENEKSLTMREYMVGAEFHNKKEELIELLLDSDSNPCVVVLGMLGSGKSTLIWDALNDSRIQNYFEEIDTTGGLSLPDWSGVDVDKFKDLFSEAERSICLNRFHFNTNGSNILIISNIQLDTDLHHLNVSSLKLPALYEDESWSLFQKIAFTDMERPPSSTLVDIARKICERCENIPGVIDIVASILSSKSTTEEWQHFLNVAMISVPEPITTISSTIEFTKMHLIYDKRHSRYWFAWCSLIPKDYEFSRDHLFHLWRAYERFGIDTITHEGMIDELLHDCFNEFLSKGYLLEGDGIGSLPLYKINNLVFELMKYVGGDDFCLVDKATPEPNHNIIRHASFIVDRFWEPPPWLFEAAKQLRSLLLWPRNPAEVISSSKLDMTLARMTQLRIFYYEVKHCELYPEFVAKLKKLEYLRMGLFSSISLPKDILPLQKLQYVDLRYDPQNLAPNSVESLTDGNFGEEEHLALLIKFTTFKKLTVQYGNWNELNLKQTNKILESLNLQPTSFDEDDWKVTSLNTRQTLESLVVCRWNGETLPAWVIDEYSVFLRSLLAIQIANCGGCQHLPGFDTLPLLCSLQLGSLPSLIDITISGHANEACLKKSVYPSLKSLMLCDLPELKGWLSKESDHNILQYYFPVLTEVRIQGCPKLMFMPSVPKLESLGAINSDFQMLTDMMFPLMTETSENQYLSHMKYLEIDGCKKLNWGDTPAGSEHCASNAFNSVHSLKLTNIPEWTSLPRNLEGFNMLTQLTLCWLVNLKVLPEWIGQLTQLRQLSVQYCPILTKLPKSDDSFYALEQLEIRYCPRVYQLPESLPKLKRLQVQEFGRVEQMLRVSLNLEELEINNCYELEWKTSVKGDASVNVWEQLICLHSLKLIKMDTYPTGLEFAKLCKLKGLVIEKCPKLTYIPQSLCSLSTLEHLRIHYYPGLINLPDNFENLGCLKKLEIRVSPQLEKKCMPYGENWSLIQHIPNIIINDSPQQQV